MDKNSDQALTDTTNQGLGCAVPFIVALLILLTSCACVHYDPYPHAQGEIVPRSAPELAWSYDQVTGAGRVAP